MAALLPPDAVLLHIGPYKTGSTAIQASLFAQRDALAEHAVYYPGSWRRLFAEGHALMRWAPRGTSVPPESVWDDFAADIRSRSDVRVCLSTEDFGRIRNRARARKIVADLGADRLHVIAVARAYHRLLPSHWQERIKSHERLTYDEWLHCLFEGDDSVGAYRSFWSSHDIEWMASRWLGLLPPDRFTVVVTDDSDRDLLSRTFEQMLGLPRGLLAPTQEHANPSLSMNATELLRRLNAVFDEREWSDRDYRALVRGGIVPELQSAGRPVPDVPLPLLPRWVRPLVAERSRRRVAAIGSLGLDVVGDPDVLLLPEQPEGDPADMAPQQISVEGATAAVAGALDAAFRARAAVPVPPTMADVAGRDLLRELWRRGRLRVRRPRLAAGSPTDGVD